MGSSASLPSLESNGRPFGTERSLNSFFPRQKDQTTDPKGPVERLNREVEAGGRRRASRQEAGRGRETRRGARPEEVRARRQADGAESRRQVEAEGREQVNSRRENAGAANSAPSGTQRGGRSTPAPDSPAASVADFGAQLRSKVAADPIRQVANPTASIESEIESPSFAPQSQPQASEVLRSSSPSSAARVAGLGSTAPQRNIGGRASAGQPTAQPQPLEATKSAPTKTPTAALSSPELSEAQEAQRAAQVLNQFRMQLHPGLRSATIQLAPAELGRLSIRIQVEGDQVQARISADNEETLSVLRQHVHELESAFADQGYQELGFEFVLDQETARHGGESSHERDASRGLEQLVDNTFTSEEGIRNRSDALGVDTYA